MSTGDSDRVTLGRLAPYAGAFAIGLALMGYPTITYWQRAYMASNPAVGSISTSPGATGFHLLVFLAGATMVFNGFMLGLSRVLEDPRTGIR